MLGKKTGGRKKGSKNKRKEDPNKYAKKGTMPLDFMLQTMRDQSKDYLLRADMAKAAAPYLHARRAPEDKTGNAVPPMIYVHPDLEPGGND